MSSPPRRPCSIVQAVCVCPLPVFLNPPFAFQPPSPPSRSHETLFSLQDICLPTPLRSLESPSLVNCFSHQVCQDQQSVFSKMYNFVKNQEFWDSHFHHFFEEQDASFPGTLENPASKGSAQNRVLGFTAASKKNV